MPEFTGYAGEPLHEELVKWAVELEAFYRQQLGSTWRKWTQYWKLYLGDRPDTRLPHEKWRARTHVPYPYSGVETKVSSMIDVMLSSDPPIQADGQGVEDDDNARKISAWSAYFLRGTAFPYQLDGFLRDLFVQGTNVWKVGYQRRARKVYIHPTPQDYLLFQASVENAVKQGAPPFQMFPSFEMWRDLVNKAAIFGQIPEQPKEGPQEIVEYQGPMLDRPSMFDLRYDLNNPDVQSQALFMQRYVKSKAWVEALAGPDGPFDPGQVARGLAAGAGGAQGGGTMSEWDRQISDVLGVSTLEKDPSLANKCEIFECWLPQGCVDLKEDSERRLLGLPMYLLLLNRTAFINLRQSPPHWHGMVPYVPVRNVPVSRRFHGLSEYQQTGRLYVEMDTLRDLRLDAVTLAVLPMFLRLKDVGIPELQRHLRPAGMIDVSNPQGLQPVTKWNQGIQDVFREIASIKDDIDTTNATTPPVRGAAAEVGRVTATDSQSRLSQALSRVKNHVLRIEEEHAPIPRMALFLCYQFWPQPLRLRVGGDENQKDPFVELSRADFLEALDRDYKFRGASKVLNRELAAAQLQGFLTAASQLQALTMPEIRKLLKRIYETLGHKGVNQVISDEGTQELVTLQKLQQQIAQTTMMMQLQGAVRANQNPPPDQVGPETGRALSEGGGRRQLPPSEEERKGPRKVRKHGTIERDGKVSKIDVTEEHA